MSTPPFDNSYARLPARFFDLQEPTPVADPSWIAFNAPLARLLRLDPERWSGDEGLSWLAGNTVPPGAKPLAAAYAGHQFAYFVPQLGDGRAILLGEVVGEDGVRRDIQLKGAGRTKWSRGGDGRADVGPVVREYLVSEAMAALGVPTTRALAAVRTGEDILRQEGPLPGAILTRIATSHIRVGSFQYFAARDDKEAVRLLADHVIARHYPAAAEADNPYRALLEAVAQRQAALVARWMQLGFIHGVMNTDNCSIAGETIDYGPCAFVDRFHPAKVFSSIDRQGRYAWGNQGRIAHWNLAQLANCLIPVIGDDEQTAIAEAQAALDGYPQLFERAHRDGFAAKLGIAAPVEEDLELVTATLRALMEGEVDFTLFFRHLGDVADGGEAAPLRALFAKPEACDAWLEGWRKRVGEEADVAGMRALNPVFIPRNHRIEQAIVAARAGDYAPFERLHAVLSRPYEEQPEHAEYERPPTPAEEVTRTFCGT